MPEAITWCKSWKSKKLGTRKAVRQWGWWLKLKPGTIFLCALVAGEIFLALRDLSSKLVVEEAQELALKDDSPLLDRIISHIDQFIRHQKNLSVSILLPLPCRELLIRKMVLYIACRSTRM